ncbi:DUF3999 domain-containing protein [bacterium]|nr:DUF3999 domain-containing protein [bacterium]MBU3955401.1 DUF3999 domain-containing protein [bacterium]
MRKSAIFLIFTLVVSGLRADFSVNNWKSVGIIIFPPSVKSDYGKLLLTPEIYDASEKSLADARIINGEGGEVPYTLLVLSEKRKTDYLSAKILDFGCTSSETSFDLYMGEGVAAHNRIKLQTPAENFAYSLWLESSNDKKKWKIIKKNGWLFDVTTDDYRSQHLQISYPDSTANYLRVHIKTKDAGALQITGAEVFRETVMPAQEIKYGYTVESTGVKDGVSWMELKFDYKNIPVSRLYLTAADKNYQRHVKIMIPGDKDKPWRQIAEGTVWKFDTGRYPDENSRIDFNETDVSKLRVEIHNGDNAPLKNTQITACGARKEIYFPGGGAKPYKLFLGNTNARHPGYDMASFFKHIDKANIMDCGLGVIKENKLFAPDDPRPWLEKHPLVFRAILIAVCLLLGFIFLRRSSEIAKGPGVES